MLIAKSHNFSSPIQACLRYIQPYAQYKPISDFLPKFSQKFSIIRNPQSKNWYLDRFSMIVKILFCISDPFVRFALVCQIYGIVSLLDDVSIFNRRSCSPIGSSVVPSYKEKILNSGRQIDGFEPIQNKESHTKNCKIYIVSFGHYPGIFPYCLHHCPFACTSVIYLVIFE